MSETQAEAPAATNSGSERFQSLDSIRGIGAFMVVNFHLLYNYFCSCFDQVDGSKNTVAELLEYLPFRFIYNGPAAVTLFFVLSGFVLSLPYYSGRALPYRKYFIRRVTRIYPPYIVAIAVALCLRTFFFSGVIPGYSPDANKVWTEPLSTKSLIYSVLLVASTDQRLDPVTWSLTLEMRISLIFPLMMFFIVRWRWWKVLVVTVVGSVAVLWFRDRLVGSVPSIVLDFLGTFSAIFAFVVGALVAKHRADIVRRLTGLPGALQAFFGFSGLMVYNYEGLIGAFLEKRLPIDPLVIYNFTASVGSGMVIAWVLSSVAAKAALEHRFLLFLGHISYSLYLYHMLVFLGLLNTIARFIPVWATYGLAFFLSFPIATLACRWVEEPSMRLGKMLTSRRQTRPRLDDPQEVVTAVGNESRSIKS